jgi:hypothetical protein
MTVTTGDDQAARGVSGEPMEMRRGPNYAPPATAPAQSAPDVAWGNARAPDGQFGAPPSRPSRTPLLLLIAALAVIVAIAVLLLIL